MSIFVGAFLARKGCHNGSLSEILRRHVLWRNFGFTCLIFALLWLRRPDCLSHPQFWAEDGAVFFQQQFVAGYWTSIFNYYFGYIHLIPRTIAFISSFFPIAHIPLVFNIFSLWVEAVSCSAFFWPCFRSLIASDYSRAACCLVVASAPYTGGELIATACNLQIFVGVLSLLLLTIDGSKTPKAHIEVVLTVIQVFIALTAPATLLLIPILLWQIWARVGWWKVRPLIHTAALCLQAWAVLNFKVSRPTFRFDTIFISALSSGLTRCVLEPMIGTSFLKHVSPRALITELTLTLIAGVIVATCLVMKLKLRQLKWVFLAGYFGVGSLIMALSGRGLANEFLTIDGIERFGGARYFFVGAAIFIVCLAFALETFLQNLHPGIRAGLLLSCFLLGITQNFLSQPSLIDLKWKENAPLIERWLDSRRRHSHAEALSVPINPPGWVVAFPAEE